MMDLGTIAKLTLNQTPMNIYLFTITYYDYILIVQIYSSNEITAKQSIMDIHGCEDWQVEYSDLDETALPMNWNARVDVDLKTNKNYSIQ